MSLRKSLRRSAETNSVEYNFSVSAISGGGVLSQKHFRLQSYKKDLI